MGQISQIFAVAGEPVDSREMSGIGQGFIKTPEAAHKTLGILGHRLGEVTALGRYGSDDGDGTLRAV